MTNATNEWQIKAERVIKSGFKFFVNLRNLNFVFYLSFCLEEKKNWNCIFRIRLSLKRILKISKCFSFMVSTRRRKMTRRWCETFWRSCRKNNLTQTHLSGSPNCYENDACCTHKQMLPSIYKFYLFKQTSFQPFRTTKIKK